ncbi:MAG: adenylosuccinate lyase, partial [Acidimicrobiia bacterium]|nr:adenylosuccinate lyase [Acidimicrobiia bacterium]
MTDQIPNVLAARYASPEMVSIWSPRQKVVTERRFWITVLEAQRELGISIPEGVVADY